MINENILIFCIILILTYVFDHKILPQFALFCLVLIQVRFTFVDTITEDNSYYAFLYVLNMMYIAFMIFIAPNEPAEVI
jgi:hypothetical protein